MSSRDENQRPFGNSFEASKASLSSVLFDCPQVWRPNTLSKAFGVNAKHTHIKDREKVPLLAPWYAVILI